MKKYESWGHYPKLKPAEARQIYWRHEPLVFPKGFWVLPFAYGRSYGDCCLNEGGVLLDTTGLNRFIRFDRQQGILRCEAGVSLAQILDLIVPNGWFLPVTPGTKFVSVGGAIANDVHGKNHHRAGTFGCHVTQFELLRSDGQKYRCSPRENVELFQATIGGLGLTGLITWAEFILKPITTPYLAMESLRFSGPEEFLQLTRESDTDYEYTVAWIDSSSKGTEVGRGIFMRANHLAHGPDLAGRPYRRPRLGLPCNMPEWLLNRWTIRTFNRLYDHRQGADRISTTVHYDPFFYPLDRIIAWNRLYGKSGFLQYQCVIPFQAGEKALRELLSRSAKAGLTPFLTVLKAFGDIPSPGLLSFPRPGITLAMDVRFQGKPTLKAMDDLDEVVRQSRGAVYPAKDARMSRASFHAFFPQWQEFARYRDPYFSSSFWRRVTDV